MTHHCPECGAIFEDPKAKARSSPQHRRYMALCAAAYATWPEQHVFRPRSAEHLRYFLECQVEGGFVVTKTARIMSADPDKVYGLMRAFLQHSDDMKLFIELDGNLLIEKKAKSVAFDSMSQNEFSDLCKAVEDVIEVELGLSAEKLLRENEKAA